MNKSLKLEFYTFEDELWYRVDYANPQKLTEHSIDIIALMIEKIELFYPKAYDALSLKYEKCKLNLPYFRYKIVNHFCKCNFGNIDNILDLDEYDRFNFEHVPCPRRGECKLENVCCSPTFNHQISDAEMRVLTLLYKGVKKEEIANDLYLSIHTVNNHIHHAFSRIGVHTIAEFTKYADLNHLFL